jgi:hypothetical protein
MGGDLRIDPVSLLALTRPFGFAAALNALYLQFDAVCKVSTPSRMRFNKKLTNRSQNHN